ncbi:MAG: glycoside hydrolase family 3 protein [Clostridiales bacterium]|nr:glycoside hydrolase family 3 protein [Clostridiales bacterium]
MPELTLDWKEYKTQAVEVARNGSVLLKNDRDALPVGKDQRIALFGRMQANYYKSGTGSGGMVNVNHVYNIREGLLEAGAKLDQELMTIYDEWEKENPVDPGVGWGQEKWSQEEMPVEDDFVERFSKTNDVAVIVIARTAGEDRDNTAEKGSYYLSDGEEELLSKVCKAFPKTVVLLNVGNIIDMSWVTRFDPAAVMYVWQAGMYGGLAVGDLVMGNATPSGCLTDTIAYNLEDYPSSKNFGDGDGLKDTYEEDIFVGYRYFVTFAPDKVQYPFGYGLSYTSFEVKAGEISYEDKTLRIDVKVKNTGAIKGSKAVMIYADLPSGKLTKPSRILVGFGKTKALEAGEEGTVSIVIPRTRYASYDDDGRLGKGIGWMLEKGAYRFMLGSDIADVTEVYELTLEEDVVLENLKSALKPVESFKRMTNNGMEDVPVRTHENIEDRLVGLKPEIPQTGDKGIKLSDVKTGKNTMDEFIAQLTDEDLALMIRGEGMSSPKVTTGTAGAFAGVTKHHMELGIPTVCCSDGPSGMRIDSGKKAFSLPNGTCIASTFDMELIEQLFVCFGKEMLSNEIDAILGPGMNIHRFPLNGRNFEYFSEDPLVTGLIGTAQLNGLHKVGVTAVIKHFCANNRETNRRFMDSVISEKALREIYMRGFEIAVKEGNARSIMSVYNKINGVYGTANYELNTEILRNQWGYTGIVMTDWWAFITKVPAMTHRSDSLTEHSYMAKAQCDLFMVCSHVEKDTIDESDIVESLTSGNTELITRAEMQRNARNILNYAMKAPAMDRLMGDPYKIEHVDCPFKDDTVVTRVDNYYQVKGEGETIIEVDTDTSTGADYTFGLDSDVPGRYDVTFTARSELGALAQIPMTVYCTSIPFRVMTWNGLEGHVGTQDTTFMLISKYNVFRIHFGGAGVKLLSLKLKLKVRAEDDPDPNF